jgi:hypothetical protein
METPVSLSKYQRYRLRHLEKCKAREAAYRDKNREQLRERDRNIKAAEKAAMSPEELEVHRAWKAAYDREYRKKNKERRKALADAWRKTEAYKALRVRNYKVRKIREGIGDRKPKKWTPEYTREYRKRYWVKNKERLSANTKKLWAKNREKYSQTKKKYYEKNKRACIENNKRRVNFLRKTDINFRIIYNLRGRVREYIVGRSRSKLTLQLIGCTVEELRAHIEKQWVEGMCWENYGRHGWHIDHRHPLSLWENLATDFEVQKKAFHFTNLSPKWGVDNSRKGNRYAEPLLLMEAAA